MKYIDRNEVLDCLNGKIKIHPSDLPALQEYLVSVNKKIQALPTVEKISNEEIVIILQHRIETFERRIRLANEKGDQAAANNNAFCKTEFEDLLRFIEQKAYADKSGMQFGDIPTLDYGA